MIPARQLSFQPVAIGAAVEATKRLKYSGAEGREGDLASTQAVTRVNAEQAPKTGDAEADRLSAHGKAAIDWDRMNDMSQRLRRGMGSGMCAQET